MRRLFLIGICVVTIVFFLPHISQAASFQIIGVLSAKTQLTRGEVFEVQVAASQENEDTTANLVINGKEYFANDGGGACRSDNGLFLGWIQGNPMAARIGCTVPTDTPKGATVELIAYQFRNCPNGATKCNEVKGTQKLTLNEEDKTNDTTPKPTDSSQDIGDRINQKKSVMMIIFEAMFGKKTDQSTTDQNTGGNNGGSTPTPQPTSSVPDGNQSTGKGGDVLTLNSTAATTECLMMHVAANYKHPGEHRNVNSQCQSRTSPKKYQDECIPWELLGAIQEKETGLPGESIYFSATADQVVQNTKNACSVLVGACPTSESSYAGGNGGAVGIAQFLPSTWVGHKDTILSYESGMGYTSSACNTGSGSYPTKIGSCYPGQNCSASSSYKEYTHPCNVISALYAMANKLYGDSGRTVCKTNGWTTQDVYNAAGSYFGACEYHGNTYCADIVTKMRDRGYTF
jgi:hypothetical protein